MQQYRAGIDKQGPAEQELEIPAESNLSMREQYNPAVMKTNYKISLY